MANFLNNLVNRLNQRAEVVRVRSVSMFESEPRIDLSSFAAAGQLGTDPLHATEQYGDEQPIGEIEYALDQTASQAQSRQPQGANKPETRLSPAKPKTKSEASEINNVPAQLGYLVHQPTIQLDQHSWELRHTPEIEPVPQGDYLLDTERAVNSEVGAPPWEVQFSKPGESPSIRPKLQGLAESQKLVHINPQISAKKDPPLTEPVINVTIGSVEVIAVPPSKPQKLQKQSRKSLVMNLDEYLKSQEQERQI